MLSRWVPVALCVAMIFALSSWARPPGPGIGGLDKLAHLVEYAILGGLLLRALRGQGVTPVAAGLAVLAIGAVIATADELYQHTVPGRVASVGDGLADLAGVALAWGARRRWEAWREARRGGAS